MDYVGVCQQHRITESLAMFCGPYTLSEDTNYLDCWTLRLVRYGYENNSTLQIKQSLLDLLSTHVNLSHFLQH